MTDFRLIVPALRALLVALAAAVVLLQVLSLPGTAAHRAAEAPERAPLAWSLLAVGEVLGACALVVLVAAWRLLGLVRRGRGPDATAARWADVLVAALVVGWLVAAGTAASLVAFALVTPELRDPGLPLLLGVLVLAGLVLVLVALVLRELLRRATPGGAR